MVFYGNMNYLERIGGFFGCDCMMLRYWCGDDDIKGLLYHYDSMSWGSNEQFGDYDTYGRNITRFNALIYTMLEKIC